MRYCRTNTDSKLMLLFRLFAGILVLSLLIYSLYFLALNILGFVGKIRSDVLASIIAGFFVFIVHIVVAFLNQRHLKQRDIDESHRTKKVEIYKKYLDLIASMHAGVNKRLSQEELTDKDIAEWFVGFKTELVLWGSQDVIKFFQGVHQNNFSNRPKELHVAIENLYKAIREDIGLSNKGLNNFELNKMYLSNPEEVDELMKNK